MKTSNQTIQCRIDDIDVELFAYDHETLSDQCRSRGYHAHNDVHLLRRFLSPTSTFVDLGANIGWYTVLAAKIMGDQGRIYAFEPEDRNHTLLSANCVLNHANNVKIIKAAAMDRDGSVSFYLNPENAGDHSISHTTYQRCFSVLDEYQQANAVDCVRLDSVFDQSTFDRVDLIKIDIQGSEPQALQGANNRFHTHRPALIVEYSPAHIYSAGGSPLEIAAFVDKFDYVPFQIVDHGVAPCGLRTWNLMDFIVYCREHRDTYVGTDLLLIHRDSAHRFGIEKIVSVT